MYQSNDGKKCAIGCLIPDRLYREEIEGKDILGLLIRGGNNSIKKLFENVDIELLISLQYIHDNEEVVLWKEKLELLADEYDLKIPEVVE